MKITSSLSEAIEMASFLLLRTGYRFNPLYGRVLSRDFNPHRDMSLRRYFKSDQTKDISEAERLAKLSGLPPALVQNLSILKDTPLYQSWVKHLETNAVAINKYEPGAVFEPTAFSGLI